MKNIIRILLFFFIVNLPYKEVMAQEKDSVVVLPHSVALWYLERHELSKTLEVKISLRDSIIVVYESRINLKDSIILKERATVRSYRKIIKSLERSKDTYKKDGEIKDKKIKKVKTQRNVVGVFAIVIIILALIK